MFLIVGLGNPGKKYEKTRHNAGFIFVEQLAEFIGWDSLFEVDKWSESSKGRYESCVAKSGGRIKTLFVKPHTFMNESGTVVRRLVSENKITISKELIVAHDDLDIELGKYKIQSAVSPKVHNGVRNVEYIIARKDFLRIRLGVDSRGGDRSVPGDEYVIQKMTDEETVLLDEAVTAAVKQLRSSIAL